MLNRGYFVNHSYDYRTDWTDPLRLLISNHKHCRFYINIFENLEWIFLI